ncbi:hypothetical protein HW555_000030 [Spodoptera exigua]|uniref:Uncharacterized protein n=1 Tax=Spodoptera exigua TaxID=7107 RepID=A0A835GSX1_SPOEX|nr:hypothetical protein HW555_000030 [Spodoptera exigua]
MPSSLLFTYRVLGRYAEDDDCCTFVVSHLKIYVSTYIYEDSIDVVSEAVPLEGRQGNASNAIYLRVHHHRSCGGVGGESPADDGAHSTPELQQCVAKRTGVGVPLCVVELKDEALFHHHL